MIWKCCRHTFDFTQQGEIMGILNVTPDSFSDGGRFSEIDLAVKHGREMISDGAAIIDIGGESTRPGAEEVSLSDESKRVIPVITALAEAEPCAAISIDTVKADIASEAIAAGASIINDVTGLTGDTAMGTVAAETGAGVVIMHMQGTPRTMQQNPTYENVVDDVRTFFEKQFESALKAGIEENAIVFDPGIGFGKTLEHNLELLRNLKSLSAVCGRPLLLGVSRKSFIAKLIGSEKIEDRNWPTVAITSYAREMGVPLHRVHEVKPNLEALRMTEAILG